MFQSQAAFSSACRSTASRRPGNGALLAAGVVAFGLVAGLQPGSVQPSDAAMPASAAPIVLQDTDLAALRDKAESARAQLLARPGVAAVTLEGLRQQGVAIDYAPRRLAALGITPGALAAGLEVDASQSRPGHLALSARATPGLQSVADREVNAGRGLVRLGDVALVSRVKLDPPVSMLQVQGVPAVLVMVTQAK